MIYLLLILLFIRFSYCYSQKLCDELLIVESSYNHSKCILSNRKYVPLDKWTKKSVKYPKMYISDIIGETVIKRSLMLIGVQVYSTMFYDRYVYRKLYKNYEKVQLLFFLGLTDNDLINGRIIQESMIYKDMVIFNFTTSYQTLHIQTYNFLKWIERHKHMYKYIIKQDSDTFLNIPLLLDKIKSISLKYNNSFMMGYVFDECFFCFTRYRIAYASGMCYIFPSKIISEMNKVGDELIKKTYPGYPEDFFTGKLIQNNNKIKLIDSNKCYNLLSYLNPPKELKFSDNLLIVHHLKISEIAFIHLHFIKNLTVRNICHYNFKSAY